MFKTDNPDEWQVAADGDTFSSPGALPTEAEVRTVIRSGLYLHREGKLLLVGSGTSYTVRVTQPGDHVLTLRMEEDYGRPLEGVIRFSDKGEDRPVRLPHELETFTVIKTRVRESDEMRAMKRMMLKQRQETEERLTAMAENFAAEREASMFRPPVEENDDDQAAALAERSGEVLEEPAPEPKPRRRAKAPAAGAADPALAAQAGGSDADASAQPGADPGE